MDLRDAMGIRLEHEATKNPPIRLGQVVAGGSWLSLIAETTPGIGEVACHRVRIQSDALGSGSHRLVAQSYSRWDVGPDQLPLPAARPLGSAQRAVDAEELQAGVDLSLVHMLADRDTVVVAWVEAGNPDLEYDGRRSRPDSTQLLGTATARQGRRARVVLSFRAPLAPPHSAAAA